MIIMTIGFALLITALDWQCYFLFSSVTVTVPYKLIILLGCCCAIFGQLLLFKEDILSSIQVNGVFQLLFDTFY